MNIAQFKTVIVVMLFYSFCITIVSYATPADALSYVTSFSDVSDQVNMKDVSDQVQESLESQINIPVIELGALVFYSGNIIIDLFMNFLFAIPEMIGLLISAVLLIFNVDSYVWATIQIFTSAVMVVLYVIGLIQILTGIRAGSGDIV